MYFTAALRPHATLLRFGIITHVWWRFILRFRPVMIEQFLRNDRFKKFLFFWKRRARALSFLEQNVDERLIRCRTNSHTEVVLRLESRRVFESRLRRIDLTDQTLPPHTDNGVWKDLINKQDAVSVLTPAALSNALKTFFKVGPRSLVPAHQRTESREITKSYSPSHHFPGTPSP